MAVWRIENDCLSPATEVKIDYKGPNPFNIYFRLRDIIKRVFDVKDVDIWEREFRWDVPGKFFIRIYVYKPLDKTSYILAQIILQGAQPSDPSKPGELNIRISGKLRTDFKMMVGFQKTALYRNLIRLYHTLFYRETRKAYLEMCTKYLTTLVEELKRSLGIA